MTEPTDKQLEDFAVEEQFLLFCDADEFTQIARAVLAKWRAQPVEREPLTDEQIEALPMWKRFVGLWPETRREIVRTIEHHHGIKGGQHGAE